jgi:beta-lactamase superfamily II metal-dependent hydrolase
VTVGDLSSGCVAGPVLGRLALDPNNDSIVLLLDDGADSMLFTGDSEVEAQQVLLDTGVLTDIDVLKMPHHGGDTSMRGFSRRCHRR